MRQFGGFDQFFRKMPPEYRATRPTFAEIEANPADYRDKAPLREDGVSFRLLLLADLRRLVRQVPAALRGRRRASQA